MNILWLCNSLVSEAREYLKIPGKKPESWLEGMFEKLREKSEYNFIYLYPSSRLYEEISIDSFTFIPYTETNPLSYEKNQVRYYEKILDKFSPDVIHIFGTEYAHTLAMMKACEKKGVLNRAIISIQGMVSIYAKHYYAFMPENDVKKFTLRDFFRLNNIYFQRKNFQKRGLLEEQAIKLSKNVIGRTDWDYACTKRLNHDIKYYFCNETLRPSFYENTWDIDKCEKYSIFVSQSLYPIKGFHLAIEAFRDVLEVYPDAHLYTTGNNPLNLSFKQKLRRTYYSKYLAKLIKKYNLENKITFLGSLKEEEMCKRFLKSHIFLSPSSIENSPNSVGEAMILGVPTISSDVGGVKNQIEHGINGYVYQADAPYMSAHYIMKIFADENLAKRLSEESKKSAKAIYDSERNLNRLLEIYGNMSVEDDKK